MNIENLSSVTRLPVGTISHRHFFFEEQLPETARNLHHVYTPLKPVSCYFPKNVLGQVSPFASSFVRTNKDRYRFYGTSYDSGFATMGISVWESSDGLHWTSRNLGQIKRNGKDTNLIHFDGIPGDQGFVGQPQVVPLRDGRWRMYFWKHRDNQVRYTIAESEDGLKWRVPNFDKPALYHPCDGGLLACAGGLVAHKTKEIKLSQKEILACKRLWSNDATYVYYNEQMNRYECYTVLLHPAIPDRRVDVDNAASFHRLIHRRFSENGITWSDAELIIMPDARDPWDLQFYYLAVQWHEDIMIGSLGHYRVEDGQQTMDLELCFSRDGYRWHRPLRGGFIPRSEKGSGRMDTMGVYAPNTWLDLGDKWLCLYNGTPEPHNSSKALIATLGVTFPKNRFVGLAAGHIPGGFLSEPFVLTKPEIFLDADIRGWLRAELCDAFGRKLPGFHLMDSVVVKGNEEAHMLKWKKSVVANYRYECLRLRVEYADGEIYNISF